MIDFPEEEILRMAKALCGPYLPVPADSRYTLYELREVKWSKLSTQEQNGFKFQASSALREARKMQKEKTNSIKKAME